MCSADSLSQLATNEFTFHDHTVCLPILSDLSLLNSRITCWEGMICVEQTFWVVLLFQRRQMRQLIGGKDGLQRLVSM